MSVPSDIVNFVLALCVGALMWMFKRFEKAYDDAKLEEKKAKEKQLTELVQIRGDIIALEKQMIDSATRTMLGSMGDRLDGRITNIAQELAVLKKVMEMTRG